MSRVIAWFSCGAASAVAAKLAVKKHPDCRVVYCDTMVSENEDNRRFFLDVCEWIEKPITVIKSAKYNSVDEVFEQTRWMNGIKGARCTVEMKKLPRFAYQQPDDLHIFGFTADEDDRINEFAANNPELQIEWILRDNFIRKTDCYRMLREAHIKLPRMYELGFEHNNCEGCVKASSPVYWQRTAKYFPETFARRAKQSREIGARLVRVDGERIFLDELDLTRKYIGSDGDIDCGPYCAQPRLI